MKRKIWNDSYRLINLIFAGIILAVFAYSFLYGGESAHPVRSNFETLTGEKSISTGLSRSFSSIVHLRFSEAIRFNSYGIRIFLFFLLQLFIRLGCLLTASPPWRLRIITIDIIVSAIMFIVFFWPFILNLF